MRKLIFFALIFLCGIAKAQIYTPSVPTTYGHNENRIRALIVQHIPEKDSSRIGTNDTTAQIYLDKRDSSVWGYYKPRGFFKISDKPFDTLNIYVLLNSKLDKTDTIGKFQDQGRYEVHHEVYDSIVCTTFSDSTVQCDTSRLTLTQVNIDYISKIVNYIDSVNKRVDSTLLRRVYSYSPLLMYVHYDSLTRKDTLFYALDSASATHGGYMTVSQFLRLGTGGSGIALTDLSATSPIFYNNTTGVISSQAASGSQNGYLTSGNWTTFNNKEPALGNPASNGYILSSTTGGTRSWIANSGSSITGLSPKAALFGRSDGTIQQDTTIKVDSLNSNHTKTLVIGDNITSSDYTGKKIECMGNSITQYSTSGATSSYYSYINVAMRQFIGFGPTIADNLGLSGATITSNIGIIPTKTSDMVALSAMYGSNEVLDTATWTHAVFVAGVKRFLDTAIARGWSASQIIVSSIPGPNYGMSGSSAVDNKMREFNSVMDSLCTVYGCKYNDQFEPFLPAKFPWVGLASLHPANQGHEVMGYILAGALKGSFNMTNQKLAVNGVAQFSDIILKNQKFIGNPGQLLGIDTAGNVGVTHYLPPHTTTLGELDLNGMVYQKGASAPASYDTAKDIVLKQEAKIISSLGGSNRDASYTPITATGASQIWNGNSGGLNLNVYDGVTQGTNVNMVNFGASGMTLNKDLFMSSTYGIYVNGSAGNVYFKPNVNFNGQFTELGNLASAGRFKYFGSNGTTNSTPVQMFDIDWIGRFMIQQGGTYSNIPSSQFTVTSNTQANVFRGVLFPRLTTSQRDSIQKPLDHFTIVSGGSSYSAGPILVLSTPSGSIAGAGTSNAVAGVITVTNVTNTGGYVNAPTVTVTDATGSGASITAVLGNVPFGVLIMNTTTGTMQYADGSGGWVDAGSSGASGTVTSVGMTGDNVIYNSSVTGSAITTSGTLVPVLKTQSAYTLLGRGSSTGAWGSLSSIDSNWIPSLHSEGYYNTKYAAVGAGGGTSGWGLNGNSAVSGNFLGTTNNFSLRFKTNNTNVAVLDSNGRLGLGIASPLFQVDVQSAATNGTIVTLGNFVNPGSGNDAGAAGHYSYSTSSSTGGTIQGGFNSSLGGEFLGFKAAGTRMGWFNTTGFVSNGNATVGNNGTAIGSGLLVVVGGSTWSHFSTANDEYKIGANSSTSTWGYKMRYNAGAIYTIGNTFKSPADNASQVPFAVLGAASQTANLQEWQNSSATVIASVSAAGKMSFDATNTTTGTTGAQTINKPSGTVNFAASATSLVVTNSTVTANSIVTCVVMTNDATAYIKNVVPASGSFTITLGAAATAETRVGFVVNN